MVEQQQQARRGRSVGMTGVCLAALVAQQACAVAHAQPRPAAGDAGRATTTASADAGPARDAAATASDASTAATTTDASTAPPPAYTGPPPWVQLRPPRVGQGLTPDGVRRAITAVQPDLTNCYTRQLAANPRARGALSVRVAVIAGGIGDVQRVRFAPRNQELETCAQGVLGRVSWPTPRNVPSSDVDATIDFAPTPPATPGRR